MKPNQGKEESQQQADDVTKGLPSAEYQFAALFQAIPEPEKRHVLEVLRYLAKWTGTIPCLLCFPFDLLKYGSALQMI